ncbi:MAG: formylglycine-generating enzyme family protein [Actinobacteria bacterium]|nr:formylglycine-generating enzyme family protein [Actinomycetota bacterium]
MTARPIELTEHPRWVRIGGGRFRMGSFDFFPEEAPQHERRVETFEIAQVPTTNRQFAAFVEATGYVTVAERASDEVVSATRDAPQRAPGALVFMPTDGPVDLRDGRSWWRWVPGAQWRHPLGPGSDLNGKTDHPVVQIAYADALAYAEWAGGRLPTEAEHEYASGGGGTPAPYAWGRERDPGGMLMANTWHGRFPYLNTGADGWVGTSPVAMFPPNGFGLFDCIGNVWEWTSDLFLGPHADSRARGPAQPAGFDDEDEDERVGTSRRGFRVDISPEGIPASADGRVPPPGTPVPRHVVKGGSHLSAPEQSLRYRPAARSAQAPGVPTSHIGFRLARS